MRGLNSLKVYGAAQQYAAIVGEFLRAGSVPINDAEQLRRSAKSISDNIAEGHGYGEGNNRRRFYRIARGSAQESLNQIKNLRDDGLIPLRRFYRLFNLGRAIVRMLTKLIGD